MNKVTERIIDGLSMDDIRDGAHEIDEMSVAQCRMCSNVYSNGTDDRINMVTYDMFMNGDAVCWHCVFQQAYPVEARANFDGAFGKTICDYVLDCQATHDQELCPNTATCFVCDFINFKPIDFIKHASRLTSFYPPKPKDMLEFDIEL